MQQTMEIRISSGRWSELPMDILISLFERLSFMDFHRSKIVCSNWYLCSKQTLLPKAGSPLLVLFPEDDCVLCNPEEDRVHKMKRDFSGFRFLANSGKWFLVVDSGLNLSIIDLFSEKKIDLPPLDLIEGATYTLKRIKDTVLMEKVSDYCNIERPCGTCSAVDLRGVLWVDEDKDELEYVVAWRFDISRYIGFCKNGYDIHLGIPTENGLDRTSIRLWLKGVADMVLKGEILYIFSTRWFIRILDLSVQDGFKDVSDNHVYSMHPPDLIERSTGTKIISNGEKIAVTTSGDVLLVDFLVYEDFTSTRHRIFRLFKRDPTNQDPYRYRPLVEVESLGDEALFLDSGITVPVNKTLGIEPNYIYFTSDDRVRSKKCRCLDICVYNLASKTIKRFPCLSELNIKGSLWFLPS